jgi:hypothetical protein
MVPPNCEPGDGRHERQTWLLRTLEQQRHKRPSFTLSTQGLLLLRDIEIAFCAGAWLSVIILSYAAIDATLRDVQTGDHDSMTAEPYGDDPELDWLGGLRNQLVHVSPPGTPSAVWKLPPADLIACHAALEPETKRPVAMVYRQISSPAPR